MTRLGLLALVAAPALAACFDPTFDNPTCGPSGECPSGTTCIANVCRTESADVDAWPDAPEVPTDGPDDDGGVDDTDAPIDAPPQCAAGDVQSPTDPTRCFHRIENMAPWQQARNMCMAMGGDLADLLSLAENDALVPLVAGDNQGVWLGGTDMQIEGSWRWVRTGEPVTLDRWFPGEPSGFVVEDCMRARESGDGPQWEDYDCAVGRRAICLVPPL